MGNEHIIADLRAKVRDLEQQLYNERREREKLEQENERLQAELIKYQHGEMHTT